MTDTTITIGKTYFDWMIAEQIAERRLWVETWYGPRCSVFEPTCIICRHWAVQDEFEELVK